MRAGDTRSWPSVFVPAHGRGVCWKQTVIDVKLCVFSLLFSDLSSGYLLLTLPICR